MEARARLPKSGADVVVIGAGVIGLAVAAALAKAGRSVLILERESRIASGITSRNSEVIHAGLYDPVGSLKSELCVRGRERLYEWCDRNRVTARRIGKLIVATSSEEESVLDDLFARGRENGVVGLERIDAAEIARLEPSVVAGQAIYSRESGILDGQAFCMSLLAAAEAGGAVLSLGRRLVSLEPRPFGWQVEVVMAGGATERFDAGLVVDAAGLAADAIAELAGLDPDRIGWRQHPCKGDYFSLAPGETIRLERLVYPVPQRSGLGIHVTLDLSGRIRFGPDAEYVSEPGYAVDPSKASRFAEAASRYLPELESTMLVPDYAGIRPKRAGPGEGFRDFVIEEASAHGAPGFVACIGIESPGLTAALAIAERVAEWHSI